MLDTTLIFSLVPVAFGIAFTILYILSVIETRRKKSLRCEDTAADGKIVLLFEDDVVVDKTPAAEQLLSSTSREPSRSDWVHFASLLQSRFPNLTEQVEELADLGELVLTSADGSNLIKAEWRNGLTRVELVDTETQSDTAPLDRLSFDALQHELECLRATSEHIPLMVWRENENGKITWANRAYLDAASVKSGGENIDVWPPEHVFERPYIAEAPESGGPRRIAAQWKDDENRHWFELHEAQLGNETLFTAIPADRVVEAETSRSEFITTLTKTFAHLPIGLVIFDRSRQLTLFNPALIDLVALPASFLVARPTLFTFLDHLREKRMIPEPTDYMSWRQQMADLEAAAVNGTYEETWSLPAGQTYRVTGRPHPDGAVAFLFEDISAEISLTRRFRTELEMGQSALDCIEDAVAVFTPGGVLSMSNQAYDALWGNDPSTSLTDINVGDAITTWRQKSTDTQVWTQLKEFIATQGERSEWSTTVNLQDGRDIECRFVPMVRGATLASFRAREHHSQSSTPETDLIQAEA